MYYQIQFSVPRNTPATEPVEQSLGMVQGMIKEILVGFPPGCAALTHVQLYYHGWQLLPANYGESLAWDAYIYELPLKFPLDEVPYQIDIKAWNEDDSYDHTVFIGVILDPGETDEMLVEFFRMFWSS